MLMHCFVFLRYRVFLGHKQYFVSSDVGGGKMQWYAFYNEPAGGEDAPNGNLQRFFFSARMVQVIRELIKFKRFLAICFLFIAS